MPVFNIYASTYEVFIEKVDAFMIAHRNHAVKLNTVTLDLDFKAMSTEQMTALSSILVAINPVEICVASINAAVIKHILIPLSLVHGTRIKQIYCRDDIGKDRDATNLLSIFAPLHYNNRRASYKL